MKKITAVKLLHTKESDTINNNYNVVEFEELFSTKKNAYDCLCEILTENNMKKVDYKDVKFILE